MSIIENTPTFLTYSIFILLAISIAVFRLGKKSPTSGILLIWTGIISVLIALGLDSGLFLKEDLKIKIWKTGWILPRDEIGAITVGVYQDALSLAMTTLSALVVGIFLLNKEVISQEPHKERIYSSLAMSTAGVALAWNSLTPWMAFAGLILTIVGGFITLASRWDTNREAYVAARFSWERSAGFLLSFFGACVLVASRSALVLNEFESWATGTENLTSTWIGAALLVSGLFVQMQPFPLVGWIVKGSEIAPSLRILLNQVFPAWAAFALLLRLHPQLEKLGLFPGFGWIALASSVLIVCCGLFQNQWRLGLSAWLAAAFSLSCAFMAFSGPLTAIGLMIAVSLGALCLSSAAATFEKKCTETPTNKKRAVWLKIASILAMASGTGVIGFVSATGGIRWMVTAVSFPGLAPLFVFAFFLYAFLGWKLAWQIIRQRKASDASYLSIISLFFWIVLSLGLVWTGHVTGDILFGRPDQVMGSLLSLFFGANASELSNTSDYISASGLYWGGLLTAFIAAFWITRKGEDRWLSFEQLIPRASRFFAQGYGVDSIVSRMTFGTRWVGKTAERLVDQKIWSEWMPQFFFSSLKTVSGVVSEFDVKLTAAIGGALRKVVEIPAKSLQLIQTGDVRWYLFFALGSGFALLLHFLKA